MNFCLPSVDGYLLQQQQTLEHPSEQSVPSGARNTSPETAAAVGGPSATLTLPPANSLKSLLHQIAGVVAAAQKIPGGDDYTIRTSTSSGARRATEAAAADTLRILLEIAAGCSGRTESLIPLRKAEALHRSLAHTGPSTTAHNGTGSSSSSALLEQDGQQIHEGVGTVVQGLLDELLEAVDVSLEAHRRNPQKKVCTRLSQEQQEEKSNAQKKGQKEQHQDADIAAAGGTATLHRSKRVLPLPGLLSVVEGRPQSHWAYLINNNSRRFVPRLHQKPHKKYPLPEATIEAQKHRAIRLERRRELFEDAVSTGLALETAVGHQRQLLLQQLQQQEEDIQKLQHEEDEAQKAESPEPLPHPYEGELNELEWLLPGDKQQPDIYSDFFTLKEPPMPQPVERTPLVLVETPQQLREMLDELCSGRHKVVAIDTEHHSYESYKGFVCLLQLSTCSGVGAAKDFIVDPFSLFAHLPALNELTANPKILKILHGSASDVLWLQRDFSVYLVNVFDTAVAARTLAVPGGASLANLLSFYMKKQKDKKMQLADWRVRPLTEEMKAYGRSDTHYLPYIYQCMQNQILARDDQTGMYQMSCIAPEELGAPTASGRAAMLGVLERSRDICLSLYTEGPFDEEKEATQLLKRNSTALAPLSFAVLKGLLSWRDSVARKRDVSPHAVLANACILLLAQRRPLNHVQLRHAIRPTPAAVHRYGAEILKAIQGALEKTVASSLPTSVPDQHRRPGEQQQGQQQQQQSQQQQQPELRDDDDDLLPSATVLREAVAAQQQQLIASADASISASHAPKEETEACSRSKGYDSTSASSSGNSTSRSSSSYGESSKPQEQQERPVQLRGFFSMGANGPKPPVIVRVSSAVLSSHMEGMTIHRSAGPPGAPSSSENARNASHTARQVARWVYRQLQRMEKNRLLYIRTTKHCSWTATPAKQRQEQAHNDDIDSTDSLMLPAHPPPPPDPETVAALAAEQTRISVSAPAASAEAAAASDALPAPSSLHIQAKDFIEGDGDRKRGHPETADTSLGLIPVAQQTWKRRKKQRKRAAAAEGTVQSAERSDRMHGS